MSFFSKVLQSFLVQIIILICGMLTAVVTARCLGPEGRGIYAVLQTIVFMSTYLGNLGIHAAIIFFGAQADPARTQKIISTSLSIGMTIGTFITVVLACLILIHPSYFENVPTSFMLIASMQIVPVLMTYFLQHLLVAKGHIKSMNAFYFVQALSNLFVPLVVFLVFKQDLEVLIVSQTILSIILLIGLMIFLSVYLGYPIRLSFHAETAKEMIRYGFVSFLVGFMGALVMRSNVFFINYFLGAGPTGLFAVSSRYGEMLAILPGQLGLLLMPRISANQNDIRITPFISRVLGMLLLVACVAGFFFIGPVTNLLFGEKFVEAKTPAIILLLGFAFLSMEIVYANYIAGMGLPKRLIAIWILPLMIGCALNWFLIPWIGLNGAALAMTVTYGILFVLVLLYTSRLSGVDIKEYLIPTKEDLILIRTKFIKI